MKGDDSMETTKQNCLPRHTIIKLDKSKFDLLDISSLQLPLALHLMILQVHALDMGDETFSTSPKQLYDYMTHGFSTVSTSTRKKMTDDLLALHNLKLIKLSTTDFSWDTNLEIDAFELFHDEDEIYLQITSKQLSIIMREWGIKATKPIVAYLNIMSYINLADAYFYLREYQTKSFTTSDIYGCSSKESTKWHLSCFASLPTLASKPYNNANTVKWITDKTLSRYLHRLEELKLISIVTVEINNVKMNHYCLPECKEAVEVIAKVMLQQMQYSIDN